MGLIDIARLNAEVNKLIDAQKEEVAAMNAEVEAKREFRFQQMLTFFETMGCLTKELGESIRVPVATLDTDYGDKDNVYITFSSSGSRFKITRRNYRGEFYSYIHIGFDAEYEKVMRFGGSGMVDRVVNWWWDNAAEFERRFEKECLNIITAKAERANADYARAKEVYDNECK